MEEKELVKLIASKSKLTEDDALEFGKKINKRLHKRYKKLSQNL